MSPYLAQIGTLLVVNSLLALGASLPLMTGRLLVCFGTFMSVGGLVGAAVFSTGSVPFFVALLVGASAASVLGFLVAGLAAYAEGFIFSILTLSIGEVLRVLVVNSPSLGGALGFTRVHLHFELFVPTLVLVGVIFSFWVLDRRGISAALLSIGRDDNWADSLGIDVDKHRKWAIVVGAFLAGMAGSIYVHTVGILEPRNFGFHRSLEIIMFPILGGVTRFWGPLVGATILTIIPEVLRFSDSARMILYGVVVLVVSVLFPEGLSGLSLKRSRR